MARADDYQQLIDHIHNSPVCREGVNAVLELLEDRRAYLHEQWEKRDAESLVDLGRVKEIRDLINTIRK